MTLTNIKVAKAIEELGHGKLPSGCHFVPLNREITEEVVIAPGQPTPKIYYLKEDETGEVVAFKAM